MLATSLSLGPRRAAFTLVELLIVVAIVALLLAILVPTGASALEEANIAQCRANLRQLHQHCLTYAGEHKGGLPVSGVVDGPHPDLVEALKGYVSEPRMYYCPSETALERVWSPENLAAGRIGYFYYSCRKATSNRYVSQFLRWSVPWPRRLVNTMDLKTWVASDAWFSGEPTAHASYKKGVNYITLGGTVDMVTESPREAFR